MMYLYFFVFVFDFLTFKLFEESLLEEEEEGEGDDVSVFFVFVFDFLTMSVLLLLGDELELEPLVDFFFLAKASMLLLLLTLFVLLTIEAVIIDAMQKIINAKTICLFVLLSIM